MTRPSTPPEHLNWYGLKSLILAEENTSTKMITRQSWATSSRKHCQRLLANGQRGQIPQGDLRQTLYSRYTILPKLWMTSKEKRTRNLKSLWLAQTSSSDISNLSRPKRHGPKHTTTCKKQSFARLLRQPLAPLSIWKNINSSKPEQSTAPFPQRTFKRSTKLLQWHLGNCLWRSPERKITWITSNPKCHKTKEL